jgi:hypothetical protein
MNCHTVSTTTDVNTGMQVFDPSSGPADPEPAGAPCLTCHGHEGIQNWPAPGPYVMTGAPTNCVHCHSFTQPVDPHKAPVIQQGRLSGSYGVSSPAAWFPNPPIWLVANGNVLNLTGTSATIYWETDVSATSFVEYGVSTPGYVAGYQTMPVLTTSPYPYTVYSANPWQPTFFHRVDLTGLTTGTTYQWRIRTVDAYRNVTETPVSTFTTLAPGVPPAPVLQHEANQDNPNPSGQSQLTFAASPALTWNAVSLPTGPAQYRVNFSTDPTFVQGVTDSGWISATTFAVNVTGYMDQAPTTYYWRVMTMDMSNNLQSSWSSADSFTVTVEDPWTW